MTRSFKSKPSIVYEAFGDETVIVNLDTGSYYSALGTSSVIWRLIGEAVSEPEILRRVRADFIGDSDAISSATARFLDQLVEEGLVVCERIPNDEPANAADEIRDPKKEFSAPLLQKYTDIEDMLLLDPIHEVDDQGWPSTRKQPE